MNIQFINLFGSIVSIMIYILCILIFIFRLKNKPEVEYYLGIIFIIMIIPLLFLLYNAFIFLRPAIYFVQLLFMIAFIIIELFLDYICKIDFRKRQWMVIVYVMFFFGGTGGMIGIAGQSGAVWSLSAVVLFIIMTLLAFYQRIKTGM